MKLLSLAFCTLISSAVYADINYSGVWRDTENQFYSIHQVDDSSVVAELSKQKTALSPFKQGSLVFTGNPLDMAITGHDYFIIEMEDGSHTYTRRALLKELLMGLLSMTVGRDWSWKKVLPCQLIHGETVLKS